METPIESTRPPLQTSLLTKLWLRWTLVLTLVIALTLYVYPSSGYFLYDDARMILQNRPGDVMHLARAFVELRDNFYRPLFEVTIGLEAMAFSGDPIGYHLVNIGLHLLTTAVVYVIGRLLIHREAALMVVAFFLATTVHAEPVIWISALTSLLPGFFAAVSFASYLLFDLNRLNGKTLYVGSVAAWVLSLLAKESAYTIPLAIAAYHILLYPRAWRVLLYRLLPFVVIMAAYAPLRLSHGTGYSLANLDTSPLALAKNALAYFIAALSPLPDDYRYPSTFGLWRSDPVLPSIVLALGLLSFILLVRAGLVGTLKRERVVWFGILWLLLTLLPVLPIYAERQLYVPSIGAAISVGATFAACLSRASSSRQQAVVASAFILLLAANLLSLGERSHWWKTAGEISRQVTEIALDKARNVEPGTKVVFLGVPDTLRITHVQGPHFPDTIQLASNNAIPARSVFTGSYIWPAPENVNHSLPAGILNDPTAVVIHLSAELEAKGIVTGPDR